MLPDDRGVIRRPRLPDAIAILAHGARQRPFCGVAMGEVGVFSSLIELRATPEESV
jgi:hypothetical protein